MHQSRGREWGSGKRLGGETAGESSDPLQARARRQLEGAGTWIRVLRRAAKWTNVGVPAESVRAVETPP